jgi:GNAT superfamily N-acetyltransferase
MTCLCGVEVTATDLEALIDPVLDHLSNEHPELDLTSVHVRNFLEAEDRTGAAPTDRLDSIGDVEVVPISPDRVEDVASFFDYEAFPDNFAWASCYCTAYFESGEAGRPWQENRAATCSRIESGVLTGSLAFVDGKLAGWCNASARRHFPEMDSDDGSNVCALVCFVVSPPYRRHGLAARLLDGAVEEAQRKGFASVEAYPSEEPESAAHAFKGSLDLYRRAGFEVVSDDPLVVRRQL